MRSREDTPRQRGEQKRHIPAIGTTIQARYLLQIRIVVSVGTAVVDRRKVSPVYFHEPKFAVEGPTVRAPGAAPSAGRTATGLDQNISNVFVGGGFFDYGKQIAVDRRKIASSGTRRVRIHGVRSAGVLRDIGERDEI
ncbi:hypothetical protein EVAR_19410_1 [Eumeta japonica]|uniref:Uncharacterized protein n=1 Tax=Eumeta variegata TaxID=151549 RepID=A0A4C1TRL6_EUMVA|nr:hypothetical protein EVAR_19410_1 [Eumeta japonica]